MKWLDGGGTAYVSYEVEGLPDNAALKAGAYGYSIGFTPSFVDVHLSTVGLASITSATLSIFGRSFDTTTDGSFNWQTFDGTGSTPIDFVSNVAPYAWYSADMTTEIMPGEGGALLRIKAGPSSGVLVVSAIELCLEAQ